MVGPNNKAPAIVALASQILAGAIANARGFHDQAIRSYTLAVQLQDALGYDEPPSWYYPVRESLGAEMIADKKPAMAEAVYRDDLKRNPDNPRSLYGLAESLRAEGKVQEAAKVEERFTKQWSHADITLTPEKLAAQ
jgi:tetratricopeptide (TPR) repeat protein